MGKIISVSAIAILALACGPEVRDEDDPSGELEYEHAYARIYRLDRRVEVVYVQEHGERRECGILTDHAHDELESTIDALEPSIDYGHDAEEYECDFSPGARIHIEGFEHSPFECSWMCCHPELIRAAWIYSVVEGHFLDVMSALEGEPYVAIEPDLPCP